MGWLEPLRLRRGWGRAAGILVEVVVDDNDVLVCVAEETIEAIDDVTLVVLCLQS